ncbi:MAG: diguanylate cyclase [Elusimicrobiota bacterium]
MAATPAMRPEPFVHLSTDFIRAKEYFEAIIASTSDAICTTDTESRIIYFSPGAEAMLGLGMADVVGKSAHQLYAGGKPEAEKVMRLLRKEGSLKNHETILKGLGGRQTHVSMSVSLLRDRGGKVIGTMAISKDISSRVELERRLRELSITDNLTGLYNQRHFHERLAQEASRAKRQRYKLSMILMDLDGFKQANDQFGHLEGDRILKDFGAAVEGSIRREVDSAYRYGGDEFVVLLPGLPAVRAEKAAKRIVSCARTKIEASGVTCSYGVATLHPTGSLSNLIRQADRGMFKMKAAKHRPPRSPSLRVTHRV